MKRDYNAGSRIHVLPLSLAFRFLTILPVPGAGSDPAPRAAFGRAAALFPLVGLALGAATVAIDVAARSIWSPLVAAALVLAALVVLTGALHLDGFLDTCDGIFLWRPERRLEVMRDSRVGSFAVAGGLSLYGLKLTALASVAGDARTGALVLAPVLGRLAIVVALLLFPYARASGAGNAFKEAVRPVHGAVAIAAAAAVAAWAGVVGGVAIALALALAWLLGRLIASRLGGLTGDTYGFISECVETATLLLFASSFAAAALPGATLP